MEELKKLESDKRQLAKPKYKEFDLSIRKSFFFSLREVEHWHRLLREVVVSPFLELLKTPLDVAPSSVL